MNVFIGREIDKIKITNVQYFKDKIVYFGEDNLLPQYLNDVFGQSQTLQTCIDKYSNAVLGSTEDLPNWVYCAVQDYYKFGGFYLFVSRNLEGTVTDVKPLSFESVRLTEPDDNGKTYSVAVSDWSKRLQDKKKSRVIKYPLFDVPLDIAYKEYNHTVSVFYYFNPSFTFYPKSRFNSVIKDIVNEGLLQDDRYFNLINGSSSKVVFRTSLPTDEVDKQRKLEKIYDWISPSGSRLIVCDSQFGSTGDTLVDDFRIDTIPSSRDFIDESFENRISANIAKAGNIPASLIGNTSSNMFSGNLIKESQELLIFDTKSDRKLFNKIFRKLGINIELQEPEIISFK